MASMACSKSQVAPTSAHGNEVYAAALQTRILGSAHSPASIAVHSGCNGVRGSRPQRLPPAWLPHLLPAHVAQTELSPLSIAITAYEIGLPMWRGQRLSLWCRLPP
eukprot:1158116-Pelagomonas_calceolata.AAC.4